MSYLYITIEKSPQTNKCEYLTTVMLPSIEQLAAQGLKYDKVWILARKGKTTVGEGMQVTIVKAYSLNPMFQTTIRSAVPQVTRLLGDVSSLQNTAGPLPVDIIVENPYGDPEARVHALFFEFATVDT